MSLDSQQFRDTLAHWASGVTVVTSVLAGRRYGMTASSFSSVSLEPPLILICVGKEAYTHGILLEAGGFGISILNSSQHELGKRFAARTVTYIDRFADLDVSTAPSGVPILPEVVAWLDCKTSQAVDAGDHTVFIAEVTATGVNGGEPLLYVNRMWGEFREAR